MPRAKSKPIASDVEGRLHPVDATKPFKVDFDLLTEDFNNIVLEDIIKLVKGKSVDRGPQIIKQAMTPVAQSSVGAPFPGAYPPTPTPYAYGGAIDRSKTMTNILRKVCDDEETVGHCAQLLSKARDGLDIKGKAPILLKDYIHPQLNDEKLTEIVRELEALFNETMMPPSTILHSKSDVYNGSESISTYKPPHAPETPVFIKNEYITAIPPAGGHTTSNPISGQLYQPGFRDSQQGFLQPEYRSSPHVSQSIASSANQAPAETYLSRASGFFQAQGLAAQDGPSQALLPPSPPPPPLPPFTVLPLPPTSPQSGFTANPSLSSRMSSTPGQHLVYDSASPVARHPTETATYLTSGPNEQRVTELATVVNATAPVGPVVHAQGSSTTFIIDQQKKILRRDAGGGLQIVAELVYHNQDKGVVHNGRARPRVIECLRKGTATFNSPVVPTDWPRLPGDLFMVHTDKLASNEAMWLHHGDGKWTNITHHWNSASLDADHSVRHPSHAKYYLTRNTNWPNWVLYQSQIDKVKKRLSTGGGSHVSFGSVTTHNIA